MPSKRSIPAALLAVALGTALVGCGDDAPDSSARSDSSTDSSASADQDSSTAADSSSGSSSGSATATGSPTAEPIGSGKLAKGEWKRLCLLTNAEVGKLVPSFGPYDAREGAFVNLDTSGAPVDLYCSYLSKADHTSGVQIMARPYVEDVEDYENPNDYATPVEAWEDACDDGDFDCGDLEGGTPYAVFGGNGYGALYPEGTYYFQVAVTGDPDKIQDDEVKALVSALEDKVG